VRVSRPLHLATALFLLLLLQAGCTVSTTTVTTRMNPTTSFLAENRRFAMEFPTGWQVTTAKATGVAHWRFTPEVLPSPAAESPSELSVAWIPLPEDLDVNSSSLAEIARYVRDATIETAAEQGQRYRGENPVAGEVGGRPSSRVNMAGKDAEGVASRLALVVIKHTDGAVVISFGCPEADAAELIPLLEKCASSFRIP